MTDIEKWEESESIINKIEEREDQRDQMTQCDESIDSTTQDQLIVTREQELADLGFTAAASKVMESRILARKLRTAYEHFRVVTPDNINKFNDELKNRTWTGGYYPIYQQLKFTPIVSYPNVPPPDVLDKVREARKLNCFDNFEVATIESVTVVPDPIVFGVINGSTNKYFVAQWDDDVKIEDILKEDEG